MRGRHVRSHTSVIPESACPYCGLALDRATYYFGEKAPTPGMLTMCIDCGELSEFGPDLRLRPASTDTLARGDPDEIKVLREAWVSYKEARDAGLNPSAKPA